MVTSKKPLAWKTSDESLDFYSEQLDKPLGGTPVIFPYKALWEFGGYARVVTPGVLMMVMGNAGGMKTAFVETLTDAWRMSDYNDLLWWGTEWNWQQMSDRAVQRYGGATIEQKSLNSLWLHEEKNKVPEQARMGIRLDPKIVKASKKALDFIRQWPGISHMLEEAVTDIDQLIEACRQRIQELHTQKREVKFIVWDYAQLLDLYGARNEAERITLVMGKIATFCFAVQIIGIVVSQSTKVASSSAKSKKRELLTADSGQNMRSDKPKLVLTLNPVYRADGLYITDQADIGVVKNNPGRTGIKRVEIDPAHFKWIDEP